MFVNTNDGTGGDTSVDVGGAIEGVEYCNVSFTFVNDDFGCFGVGWHEVDGSVFFFGGEDSEFPGEAEGTFEDVVGDYIKFLELAVEVVSMIVVGKWLMELRLGCIIVWRLNY